MPRDNSPSREPDAESLASQSRKLYHECECCGSTDNLRLGGRFGDITYCQACNRLDGDGNTGALETRNRQQTERLLRRAR